MNIYLNDKSLNQKGDDSFHKIYLNYWDKLLIYAFNILKDRELSEDVVQDVFFSFWKNSNQTEILNVSAYLFRATKIRIYKHYRDTKFIGMDIEKFNNMINASETPFDILALQDLEKIIFEHTENLPKRCQEIFYLSRFECLSHREIADKLNISIRTVKNQIHVALKYLRLNLEKESHCILVLLSFLITS